MPVQHQPDGPENRHQLLLLVLLAALIGPLLWPIDPFAQNLDARLIRPFWLEGANPAHPLGTDHLGRDYLARLLHGARISLMIGASATLVAGTIGTTLGVAAGYFGGWVDRLVLYLITVRLAMPALLIALAVIAIVGNSLTVVILVLGFALCNGGVVSGLDGGASAPPGS
jgi:peptide/nickel transport system permease protein